MVTKDGSYRNFQRRYGLGTSSSVPGQSARPFKTICTYMDTTVLDGHVIDWTTLFECHVERVHLESSSKGRGSKRSHAELVHHHSCGHEVNLRYDDDETRFFSSFGGSSWHRSDVAFIFWVLRPP